MIVGTCSCLQIIAQWFWCNKEQISGAHDLVEVFMLIPLLYFSISVLHNRLVCTLSCLTLSVWHLWHLALPKSPAVTSAVISSLTLSVLWALIRHLSALLLERQQGCEISVLDFWWVMPTIFTQHFRVPHDLVTERVAGARGGHAAAGPFLRFRRNLLPLLHPWCRTADGNHCKH